MAQLFTLRELRISVPLLRMYSVTLCNALPFMRSFDCLPQALNRQLRAPVAVREEVVRGLPLYP